MSTLQSAFDLTKAFMEKGNSHSSTMTYMKCQLDHNGYDSDESMIVLYFKEGVLILNQSYNLIAVFSQKVIKS